MNLGNMSLYEIAETSLRFQELRKRTPEQTWHWGMVLVYIKKVVGHGNWQVFLKANNLAAKTAQEKMRIYKNFSLDEIREFRNDTQALEKIQGYSRSLLTSRTERKALIYDLYIEQDGQCGWCCMALDLLKPHHIDHIDPLSRGGLDEVGKLQLVCATCNLKKGNKTIIEECLEGLFGELFNWRNKNAD